MEQPRNKLEDFIGALFDYSPGQYGDYISVEQLDEKVVKITDVITGQIFAVQIDRAREEGASMFKEYAKSKGAHVWSTVGYHWNNQAEILVDFDLYVYREWARGRKNDPFYNENDPNLKPVPNPSLTIGDIEFEIHEPSFTFWAITAFDCDIHHFQETHDFPLEDYLVVWIKNIKQQDVGKAVSILSFEFDRLKIPGHFSSFPAKFAAEGNIQQTWRRQESELKSLFSVDAINEEMLTRAVSAYVEAQELTTHWAILSLFRGIEALCTYYENTELTNLRHDSTVDNATLIKRTRALMTHNAHQRIKNLINTIQNDYTLPSKYRLSESEKMLKKVVETRHSIAHGGRIIDPESIADISLLDSDQEYEECRSWLNELLYHGIIRLAEKCRK